LPLAASTAAVALGGAAAWQAASPSPVAAWTARIFFGVEAPVQLLLLAFLLFFRLNRLW